MSFSWNGIRGMRLRIPMPTPFSTVCTSELWCTTSTTCNSITTPILRWRLKTTWTTTSSNLEDFKLTELFLIQKYILHSFLFLIIK